MDVFWNIVQPVSGHYSFLEMLPAKNMSLTLEGIVS